MPYTSIFKTEFSYYNLFFEQKCIFNDTVIAFKPKSGNLYECLFAFSFISQSHYEDLKELNSIIKTCPQLTTNDCKLVKGGGHGGGTLLFVLYLNDKEVVNCDLMSHSLMFGCDLQKIINHIKLSLNLSKPTSLIPDNNTEEAFSKNFLE